MNSNEEVKIGRRVTWVGFWSNCVLAVLKILAGVFGRSGAMVADGIHSVSDLATDVAVIFVLGASRKKADKEHAYGHGKIETLITFIIAIILCFVGLGIMYDGASRIYESLRGATLARPGMIALLMAVISILVKEILFRYTRHTARRINSSSMLANAWHHRSDALSSIATLLGIAGAMFLSEKWRILDPIAAIFVSLLIIVMAVRIGKPVVYELLETSLPAPELDIIRRTINETPGVKYFHHLRTRMNGKLRIADFHIKLDPKLPLTEAHDIATDVEKRLQKKLPPIQANIHIEPYRESYRVRQSED